MKKIIYILFVFILCSSAAYAATGTTYLSSPEDLISGGGTTEGSSYSTLNAISSTGIGTAGGTSYTTEIGMLAASVSYSTSEGGSATSTDPSISEVEFDGVSFVDNDYIKADGTLTATISGGASTINTLTSSIEVGSTYYTFDSLSGASGYSAANQELTYQPSTNYTDGTHTLTIHARNNSGDLTSETLTFRVSIGDITATSVMAFPNPFDKSTNLEIGYQLTKDGDVSVYIFDTLGRLIYKNNYPSGTTGGAAGYNTVTWDGINGFGQEISNGVYLCRIVSGGKVIGKCKIAVLK